MPRPSDSIRIEIERLEAQIANCTALLNTYRRALAEIEAHEKTQAPRHVSPVLKPDEEKRSVSVSMHVDTTGMSVATRKAAGRATRNSEAQRMIYEAGYNLQSLADMLGEGRPRVSSWFYPPGNKALRPIPRRYVERLKKPPFNIPESAWHRIQD